MNLLPRDEKFFQSFQRQVKLICQAAELLVEGATAGNAHLANAAIKFMCSKSRPILSFTRFIGILTPLTSLPSIRRAARHRLMECEQIDRQSVDLQFDRVDPFLIRQVLRRRAVVFVNNGADAALDTRFDQRTHLQQFLLELFQFFKELTHVS